MPNKIFPILLCIFLLWNCTTKEEENFLRIRVHVNDISEKGIPLSLFCDSLRYIPLETNDSSLFQEVKKVMLDQKNNIYVLDGIGTRSLYKFSPTGKFLHRIGDRGRGPGEYLSAEDFNIYQDSIIEIYDTGKEQILCYHASGKFIGSIAAPEEGCQTFIHLQDTLAFYNDSDVLPNLTIQVKDNKYTFWEKDYQTSYSGYRNFSYNGEHILYSAYYNDTIYRFHNEELLPYLYIDFGRNRLPQKLREGHPRGTHYCYGMGEVKSPPQFLFFSFFYQEKVIQALQDKQTGKLYLSSHFDNNIDQIPFLLCPNGYFDATKIVTAIDAFIVRDYYESCQEHHQAISPALQHLTRQTNENSNPIIVFAYLKK